MKNKYNFSLELKLISFLVATIILLSSAVVVSIYYNYRKATRRHFEDRGKSFVRSISYLINVDEIEKYLKTGIKDDDYNRITGRLHSLVTNDIASGIYVFVPDKKGLYYIYNSDISVDGYKLGDLKPWNEEYDYLIDSYLKGEEIPSIVMDTEYGSVFIVCAPLYNSQGQFVAYLSADYSLMKVKEDLYEFLVQIIFTICVISAFIIISSIMLIRKLTVTPIRSMADAAVQYMANNPLSRPFSTLDIETNDELELLQDSLKDMEAKTNQYVENLSIANHKAETDPLTQIYNRGAFECYSLEYLKKTPTENQLDAFILVDFDEFKSVNDTYGHAMGDEALKTLAALLKKTFRESDIVARIGGDEFAVFCKSVGTKELVAEKLQKLINTWRETKFHADDKEFSFTLSVGAAFAPLDGESYLALYENADIALYASKEAGRDRYTVYDKSMEPMDKDKGKDKEQAQADE